MYVCMCMSNIISGPSGCLADHSHRENVSPKNRNQYNDTRVDAIYKNSKRHLSIGLCSR